ncbi:MAG: FG-GAP-like repeat-containing protein, partial [Chitinophagaceae bacterium]|nr:FG-GAP-like repeat-containing protein [Chitinophagaceae bacterium]
MLRNFLFIVCVVSFAFCSQNLHAQAPTITSFTPLSAKPGDAVSITGTNFNTTVANNIVFFGATKATVTIASATSLSVTVPIGATYAPITILNTVTNLAAYSSANFNPIYSPTKTAIAATDFQAKVDFATGTSPNAVAIGDLDGDGLPDLAIANSNSTTISVYRNTSISGSISLSSFAPKVDIIVGGNPYAVAIADIDGDGKSEIASANFGDNNVSILRNTSTSGTIAASSFATKVDFATGTNPVALAINDLDGDGKPDIVAVNWFSNTLSILRNSSTTVTINTSSFVAKVDFATGIAPWSLAINDLDGDGKPDLAVVNRTDNTASVYRNTSSTGILNTSSFAAKVDFATGTLPLSIAIGDLDGDGKPDLAVSNYNSSTVSVFRNTSSSGSIGTGSFTTKVDFLTGLEPYALAIGDVDGNGKPDLAVANRTAGTLSVIRNIATSGSINSASFAPKQDFTAASMPYSVAIGDLDGDSKPEIAIGNYGSNSVSIYRNTDFPAPTIISFTPLSGVVGETVTITGTNFSTTAANNIVFFGATRATISAATATRLTVTVPNGATYDPITVLNSATTLAGYSTAHFNPIYSPAKPAIVASDFQAKVDFATGNTPFSVAIGDLDGDGKPD